MQRVSRRMLRVAASPLPWRREASGVRRIETIFAQAGCTRDASDEGAVIAPLHMATTYERAPDLGYPSGFVYSREDNPTRAMLERTLAEAEGGVAAAAFSSGMAAISVVMQALPRGSRVVFPRDVYMGTRAAVDAMAARWGLTVLPANVWDPAAVAAAVRTAAAGVAASRANVAVAVAESGASEALSVTRGGGGGGDGGGSSGGGSAEALTAQAGGDATSPSPAPKPLPLVLLYIETPSNPMLHVTGVRRTVALAHEAAAAGALDAAGAAAIAATGTGSIGASGGNTEAAAEANAANTTAAAAACLVVVVDTTWLTPLLLRPLAAGADLAVHSLSKYLAGHSDVIGGAVVAGNSPAAAAVFCEIQRLQRMLGAVPSPFDCWLTLRGMRSLPARLRQQSAAAAAVARRLNTHPAVATVHYPGLASHPQHATAAEDLGYCSFGSSAGHSSCGGHSGHGSGIGDYADGTGGGGCGERAGGGGMKEAGGGSNRGGGAASEGGGGGGGGGRYGYGGVLSFQLRGGRAAAVAASARMAVFRRATSVGGTESLVEHRASVEGSNSTTPDDLLRLSVGLEAVEDLLEDLEQALAGL